MAKLSETRVAVIGLGVAGLAAVKNLAETGFRVTGFDSSAYIGGLWHYTEDAKSSVLPNTVANVSKRLMVFTDFPIAQDTPVFPRAADLQRYLESYAEHFKLRQHFRLSSTVERVVRQGKEWALTIAKRDGQSITKTDEIFDKVVVATGVNQTPIRPSIPGLEKFGGLVLNSHSVKRPESLAGKKVLVVGLGGTSADVADGLVGVAQKIYISHRRGALFVPLMPHGKPYDSVVTFGRSIKAGKLPAKVANAARDKALLSLQELSQDFKKAPPEWGLTPTPSLMHKMPIPDDILAHAHSGAVKFLPGIKQVHESAVELTDGRIVDIDAIVLNIGYNADYSKLLGPFDPARDQPEAWIKAKGNNGRTLKRLYMNTFSLDAPDSLAMINPVPFSLTSTLNFDLNSMVIAQIWAGKSSLPSAAEMRADVDKQCAALIERAQEDDVMVFQRDGWEWFKWVDKAAGTGMLERLDGNGWKAWWLWLWDRKLYNLMLDGIHSPHMFRMFDEGKRKPWSGAREALFRVNSEDYSESSTTR